MNHQIGRSIMMVFVCLIMLGILSNSMVIGEKDKITLIEENNFEVNITLTVPQQKLNQFLNTLQTGSTAEINKLKKHLWFIFIDTQPTTEVTWVDVNIDIYIQNIQEPSRVHHKKLCDQQGSQIQTCFLPGQDFNPTSQQIVIKISADQRVQLQVKTYFSSMRNLQLNTCVEVDLMKNQSINKLFKIDLRKLTVNFQQIRITLTPINKIYDGESLVLFVSLGKYIPQPRKFDLASFYAWQMGVLARLEKNYLLQTEEIFILVQAPQNYLFDLQANLYEDYNKVTQVKTGQFVNDLIAGKSNVRLYQIKVKNPQLNNFIRIKKYVGIVQILQTRVISWQDSSPIIDPQNTRMGYLLAYNFQVYLSQNNFKITKGIKQLRLLIGSFNTMHGSLFTIQTYENSKQYNWLDEGATHLCELDQQQKSYYLSRVIRHKSQNLSDSQAQIKIFNKQGATSQKIYICKSEQYQKCYQSSKASSNSKPVDTSLLTLIPTINRNFDEVFEKKIFQLQFNQKDFVNYDGDYRQILLMVEVTGEKQFKVNSFSIEFMNVGIMDTLSEHELKKDKFEPQQFKIYHFTVPKDQSIKALIFHISYYYGYVQRFVTDVNPAGKTQDQLKNLMKFQIFKNIRNFENSIQIQDIKPQKTYFLVIFSPIRSYIGIKVQLLKALTHPTDQRQLNYTTVLMSLENTFQYTMKPKQLIMLDFNSIQTSYIVLTGNSVLPVDTCITFTKQIPIQPFCENRNKFGKEFEMTMDFRNTKKKMSLYNGNDRPTHLSINVMNFQKCFLRPIGQKIYFQAKVFRDFGFKQACLIFNIYKKGTLLITLKSSSPLRQHSLKAQFKVSKSQSRYLTNLQNIIQADQVDQSCKGQYQMCYGKLISTINTDLNQNQLSVYNTELIIQIQYIDQPIDLIDGLAYSYAGIVEQQEPKHFKFALYNTNDPVTIYVQNQRGNYNVLAKIVQVDQRYSYPTLQQYEKQQQSPELKSQVQSLPHRIFQADNKMFYLYEMLIIPVAYIQKVCHSNDVFFFKACTILISIYPAKKTSIVDAKFKIQTIQHISTLTQHVPSPGYLQGSMMNFYQIQNTLENSTISIYVDSSKSNIKSVENPHCFMMFAVYGIDQKATQTYNNVSSEKGSPELIIQKAKKGTYSLTIQGLQTMIKYCDYQVQYTIIPPAKQPSQNQTQASLKTIKKGSPFPIQLSQKQSQQSYQYLLFFSYIKQSKFKILTMFEQKLGEVLISVMPLNSQQLQNRIMSNIQNINELFDPKWKDTNSLQISNKDQGFCNTCLYVIKLECLRQFKGKLIIPEQNSQISIKLDSIIYDHLLKDQKQTFRVYSSSHLAYKLKIISGQIQVKITQLQNDKVLLEKTYNSVNLQQMLEVVQIENKLSYDYYRYVLFQMKAKADTNFMFGVLKDYKKNKTDEEKTGQEDGKYNQTEKNKQLHPVEQFVQKKQFLPFGISKTFTLNSSNKQCVTGVMQQDPLFVLSQKSNIIILQQKPFQNLQFQFWIKRQGIQNRTKICSCQLDIQKSPRSMILKIKQNQTAPIKFTPSDNFQLCLSLKNSTLPQRNNSLSLSITHTSHVNYLTPDSDILVHENINMTFMSNQDNILEVNQCSGHSVISISKDFTSVHSTESQISQIRRSNSLIQFWQKGPVYLTAQSSGLMVLNWRDINYEKAKNLGYFMYQPGSFRVLPSANPQQSIYIQIISLKKIPFNKVPKQNLPKLQSLFYQIYVQTQQKDLYQAMNCHKQLGLQMIQKMDSKYIDQDYLLKFYSLNDIKKNFSDFRYVLIAVKALLLLKNQITGQLQQYRFFYPYQELVLSDFKQVNDSKSATIQSDQLLNIVIGIIVVLILGITFWQRKKVMKYFKKKNQNIVFNDEFQISDITTQLDRYQIQKQTSSQINKKLAQK